MRTWQYCLKLIREHGFFSKLHVSGTVIRLSEDPEVLFREYNLDMFKRLDLINTGLNAESTDEKVEDAIRGPKMAEIYLQTLRQMVQNETDRLVKQETIRKKSIGVKKFNAILNNSEVDHIKKTINPEV